jgi:hypothetical protein
MINAKNVLLAILVAYVVLDVSFAFVLKRKRPLMFQHMMNVSKKEKKSLFISIVLAVAAGAGAYYIVSQ